MSINVLVAIKALILLDPESIDIMIQQLLNAKAEINKVIRPIPKKGIIRKISKNRKNNRKHK